VTCEATSAGHINSEPTTMIRDIAAIGGFGGMQQLKIEEMILQEVFV
jgi:hypothetical protein